ncbi:hypothetical protein [Oceanirhabdus seepicola]|uniref:Uncharacterized protein n=1 Tax=Oceanirhabdus seepicola TaxID=2828781 RepID=A0A9J6NWQ7_9CLOT|nr:hypothetical protein [Oceanirhabdus seepicola]MCM1988882.1 hypothetical protein [Oceanirhabdus seepicola]
MNKKLIATITGVAIAVAIGYGLKTLGIFYKKVPEEKLNVPKWKTSMKIKNPNYIDYVDEYDIVKSTDELGGKAAKYYTKYIDYVAPNGKPIRILAQNEVNDEQVLYAYSILSFYLESTDTKDKTEIANKMADNESILIMPNGADRDGKTSMLAMSLGQNLNYSEVANVGSKWYIENDYEHRDASFEEIFHLVHDYGIGTTKKPQADNETSQSIKKAMDNALLADKSKRGEEGLWALGFGKTIDEWEKEGSLEQEYIVSVIDSYYGLWNAFPKKGGMWGGYVAKSREDVINMDTLGYKALNSFLPPYITTMIRVDPSFTGDFKMYFDNKAPYTFKSQYLKNVTLTGSNNSNLYGNDLDNILMGNSGENIVNGMGGIDIVQFRGASLEYTVEKSSEGVIVTDTINGRDGKCILKNIELLRFTDKDIKSK